MKEARLRHNGLRYYLGSFNTGKRADVAVRLFKHWIDCGYSADKIPLTNRTKDAL